MHSHLSRRHARFLRSALPVLFLLGLTHAASRGEMVKKRAIEVHGHRGARARVTENTLPAFAHALAVGVDVLELDLVTTKDDQLVILHDPVLPPGFCFGLKKPLRVRSKTLAELTALRCRAPKDASRFPRQKRVPAGPIPTLADLFELVKTSAAPSAKSVRFNIEAKMVPGRPDLSPPPAAFAALLVQAFRKHQMIDRVILQSFDHAVLVAAQKLAPALRRSALVAESHPDYVVVAQAARAQIVSPHHEWITKRDVEQLHKASIQVVPWTLNDPAAWQRALDLGVDGIISDDPERLIAWLNANQLRP